MSPGRRPHDPSLLVPVRSIAMVVLSTAVGLGACGNLPTALPGWETRWIVPLESSEILISQLEASFPAIELHVEEVGNTVLERVTGGGINLELGQPLDRDMTLTLRISARDLVPIAKEVVFLRGSVSERVLLDGEELRSFLGREEVSLSGVGVMSPSGSPGAPAQSVTLRGSLELIVTMGSLE